MHSDRANVIGVCFEFGNFLRGVVVVDAKPEVIRAWRSTSAHAHSNPWVLHTCDYPILSSDETACSDRHVAKLESLNDRLRDIGPNVNVSWPASVCAMSLKSPVSAYRCIMW